MYVYVVTPQLKVDWYPWSEEAFEKARHESKPIFLSVGYSTCQYVFALKKCRMCADGTMIAGAMLWNTSLSKMKRWQM